MKAFHQGLFIWSSLALVATGFGRPSDSFSNLTRNEEATDKPTHRAEADDYRLPSEVVTIYDYDLIIKPDFTNTGDVTTFTGEVIIKGYYNANVKRLTLHAGNNLRIYSVSIKYATANGVNILSTERDAEREFLHINYESNQFATFYLTIVYTASFTGNMDGFYKTFYKAGDRERMLLLTQFEPTMARRAFPCFDEPAFKATFKLTVFVPDGYAALSNTPLDKTESFSGSSETKKLVFQRTPPMSTFTFGFLLYEEATYGPTPFGVTTHSEASIFSWALQRDIAAGRADHSLAASARALNALEAYTALPFRDLKHNASKVDQAVVPNLRMNARANWGLVCYRADRLLVDPQEATASDKEMAEEYIANELAHQWFGNLVTPSWWDYAWLSEGFDAYFQYWVVNQLHGDWRALERLMVEQQQSALVADARTYTQSLNRHVSTPAEVATKMDELTSTKGVSIVLWLTNLMGEVNVRDALRSFLSARKYNVATVQNLITSLQTHSPGNITFSLSAFISSWTDDPGYPLVTMTRNYNSNTADVKQARFVYGPSTVDNTQYLIPLTLQQGRNIQHDVLNPNALLLQFNGLNAETYALLTNTGYYRVNYDEQNWAMLLAEIKSEVASSNGDIKPVDRAQLVDDSLNLARAGVRDYKMALEFVEYMSQETDFIPWEAVFPGLRFLERMLVNMDSGKALQKFVLHILTAVYARLGFSDGGSHLDKLLRAQVLRAACAAGHEVCLRDATAAFRAFVDGGSRPAPDLRAVILCFGIQSGTDTDWEKIYNILATSEIESERGAVISALACSTSKSILERYIYDSLKSEYIRSNEMPSVFQGVYNNPIGVDIALDTLVDNFNHYLYEYGQKTLSHLVKDLAEHLVTSAQANKMRTLAANHPEMAEVLGQAWTAADDNVYWVTNTAQKAIDALETVTPVRTTTTYSPTSAPTNPSTEPTDSTVTSTDSSDSNVTDSTSTTITYQPSAPHGKSYLGLVVVFLVVLITWGIGFVFTMRSYKKIV